MMVGVDPAGIEGEHRDMVVLMRAVRERRDVRSESGTSLVRCQASGLEVAVHQLPRSGFWTC